MELPLTSMDLQELTSADLEAIDGGNWAIEVAKEVGKAALTCIVENAATAVRCFKEGYN